MAKALRMTNPKTSMQAGGRTGIWIPWAFFGLFLVVLAVNGTMIALAVSTFTGMETTSAYKKGIDYNRRLAAATEQEKLGWQASLEATADKAGKVMLTFALEDHMGAPITAADVRAHVDRPLQQGFEQFIAFDEISEGGYAVAVDLPLKGQWDIDLTANVRGQRYQLTERIQVSR